MYCPKCGTENPNDAKSCWFCSSTLATVSPASPVQEAKTSGLAVTSLVLGILSPLTCFVTAIPAIILGIVGLVKIEKSAGQLKGSGLAIAGIAIPPASLPVIALIAGIMMPALARTRTIAQRMVCANNMSGIGKAMLIYANDYNDTFPTTSKMMPALARTRTIAQRMVCANNMSGLGKAMLIYANDYNDMFPTPSKWCDLLIQYQEVTKQTLTCPSAPKETCSYAMNNNVEKLGTNAPPDMVLLFESSPGWNQSGGPEILTTENHQGEGCNILFVDGHIQFVKTKGLQNLKWESEKSEKAKTEPNQ